MAHRLGLVFVLTLWLASATAARAECVSAPELAPPGHHAAPLTGTRLNASQPTDATTAAGPTQSDMHGRVVAPVMVNGTGPYRFMVDTGANRSVLSTELAQALGLTPNGTGRVHSINSVEEAPLVDVQSLNYGAVPLAGAALPILGGAMLDGEQGVLGVDGMQGKRLRLDFVRRCIEIIPSLHAPRLNGWETIHGELRFGHLVVIPARVGGTHVNVLIDTGSDISLANLAFRDAAQYVRVEPDEMQFRRAYTAGKPVALGSALVVPQLSLNSVLITNVTFYVGDYHIFELWGLLHEPTVLIGMDVLSQARGIAIDYQNSTVQFRLPRT